MNKDEKNRNYWTWNVRKCELPLHLLDSGFEVTVYNRTKEKTIQAKEKGAKVVTSPKEIAENSELVITIVKDANAVKEISFGKRWDC